MGIQAKIEHEDLSRVFGIVSLWKYHRKNGTFICKTAFSTPEIVPFNGGNNKKHNQTYLFQSKDDKIFYFCKKDGNLRLCILNFDSNETDEFDCEIDNQAFVVAPQSHLYKLMLPENQGEDNT